MPNRIREISYASSEEDDGSIYSQDELDHSDQSTIIDKENPPAATSDEHLGVSETTPGKELVYATIIARSKESQQIETSNDAKSSDLETKLAEIERSRDYQIGRKELYKVRVTELMEFIESLVAENGDLKTKANTLTAENKAARERAMGIFG
jgi:hypothetical protein